MVVKYGVRSGLLIVSWLLDKLNEMFVPGTRLLILLLLSINLNEEESFPKIVSKGFLESSVLCKFAMEFMFDEAFIVRMLSFNVKVIFVPGARALTVLLLISLYVVPSSPMVVRTV